MTMTSATTTDRPRRSTLDRDTALRLAATEYARYLDQLRALGPDDWSRPTDSATIFRDGAMAAAGAPERRVVRRAWPVRTPIACRPGNYGRPS